MNLDYLLILLNEIDNVDPQEKQVLASSLERLVENILKLQYWELEKGRDYKHWQAMVSNSRSCIQKSIRRNPSLKKYMEHIYSELYQDVVNSWQAMFYIPQNIPIKLEQILDKNYFG